jgi:hypothetical protein
MRRILWYGTENPSQDSAVRSKHDVVFRFLESGHWHEPYIKKLVNFDDLVEIVITKGVAHRLFGFYGLESTDFTVVLACIHKNNQYTPKGAIDTANSIIRKVKNGDVIARSCDKPTPNPKLKKQT